MSRYQYYDDLSGDSSDNKNSSDESDLDVGDECNGIDGAYFEQDSNRVTSPIRAIIHADVDCFYCQCEILDRRFDPDRPIAIGQKHIVVTCNYAARAIGISKLMSREDAQRKCPYLLIVDGSDLERYRVHGRKIYEAFRRSLQLLKPGCSVCKGSMDEMTADITKSSGGSPILSKGTDAFTPRRSTQIPGGSSDRPNQEKDVFIFDKKDSGNRLITFVEDQTGAQTTFDLQSIVSTESPLKARIEQSSRKNTFLIEAANLALQVRDFIFRETGFTTTMGVSFNPLLAKLASGLRKPGKVNVLEPGPSIERLLGSMPLRKIPGIGSRTMKVLAPCLENTLGSRAEGGLPWTCR